MQYSYIILQDITKNTNLGRFLQMKSFLQDSQKILARITSAGFLQDLHRLQKSWKK